MGNLNQAQTRMGKTLQMLKAGIASILAVSSSAQSFEGRRDQYTR